MTDLLPTLAEARARFMELVAEIRPELHRYCARMAGNVFDGEDIVQDTLAKAYFALSEMGQPPPLRPWLFRIAHNTAMDFLRRYEKKNVDLVAELPVVSEVAEREPDPSLVESALSVFATLPPVQRSALVLKDVLGHSLEETAATMGTSVLAIKSALTRARANISMKSTSRSPSISLEEAKNVQRYAQLFNARDWDGLRALMGEEARIDLVSRWQRRGRETQNYYTRYAGVAEAESIRLEAGFVDGVPVVAVHRTTSPRPYFICLKWDGPRLVEIRDFYFVPYIGVDAAFVPSDGMNPGRES
jgi:RNA polymerase sigma-70 factor (ECF subfamily)